MGSAVLFGLFITFKILPKNLVNLVLAGYFALLGVIALTATLLPFIEQICSARVKKLSYTAPKFNVPSWLSKVHYDHRCHHYKQLWPVLHSLLTAQHIPAT